MKYSERQNIIRPSIRESEYRGTPPDLGSPTLPPTSINHCADAYGTHAAPLAHAYTENSVQNRAIGKSEVLDSIIPIRSNVVARTSTGNTL